MGTRMFVVGCVSRPARAAVLQASKLFLRAGLSRLPSRTRNAAELRAQIYSAIICSELSGSHVEASISSDRGKCAKCMWPVMS
jgi:hypothetical protein